jgi:acyl-CoA synthetase (AMP-forming)/AMP-acid ligase II
MIISKGMNIYPAEIENVLVRHPQIKEVAVIGIPHETFGEAVCAIAVIKNGELSLSELRKWAINELSDYKLPSHLDILQELPRNPTGKILRRELREPYWKNKQRQIQG